MAAGLRAELPAIQRLHLLPVVMVADAIEQRRDPVWVQLQVRHLLPEALAALPAALTNWASPSWRVSRNTSCFSLRAAASSSPPDPLSGSWQALR
jgi:hypothetical protein